MPEPMMRLRREMEVAVLEEDFSSAGMLLHLRTDSSEVASVRWSPNSCIASSTA